MRFQNCINYPELETKVARVKEQGLPGLQLPENIVFSEDKHNVDQVALHDYPPHAPINKMPVTSDTDGNCLPRVLSTAMYENDFKCIEIRARIVMDGVLHKEEYLTDEVLKRSATFAHPRAGLGTIFTQYSEYHIPGQKVDSHFREVIYCLELLNIAHNATWIG